MDNKNEDDVTLYQKILVVLILICIGVFVISMIATLWDLLGGVIFGKIAGTCIILFITCFSLLQIDAYGKRKENEK